jgi:hypothetical protein
MPRLISPSTGLWWVITSTALVVSCGRETSIDDQHKVSAEPMKIDDVRITEGNPLIFQYRTRTSSRDCEAQAAEMPKVWNLLVNARLSGSHAQSVLLFPEDASGLSVSFEFTKSPSGQWSAAAPCSISIPIASVPQK